MNSWQLDAAWTIFLCTYAALAIGYVPWFRLDRTGAAFVGSVAMVGLGVLSPDEAFLAQDHDTLILLFSMMIIVSFLMNSGLIDRVQSFLLKKVTGPRAMLWTVIALSGVMSALFINDVVCLMLTPLVLACSPRLGLNPMPYLLAVAMASNLGSVMTPVGNPQSIYLASVGKITYAEFAGAMWPVSLVGLLLLGTVLELVYRGKLEGPRREVPEPEPPRLVMYVFVRTLVVLVALLVGFWAGMRLSIVASAGAAVLMVTRRISRARLFSLIDWDLLVLFAALFVLTAGARQAGILDWCFQRMSVLHPEHAASLSLITLVLSNLFSNVPAVFFLAQFASHFPDPKTSLLLVAMISTLAGNLTLLGSIANLIVAEKAAPEVKIDFWTYTRVGLPVTGLTMAMALAYWGIRFGLS